MKGEGRGRERRVRRAATRKSDPPGPRYYDWMATRASVSGWRRERDGRVNFIWRGVPVVARELPKVKP